jgi:hypothetical protein
MTVDEMSCGIGHMCITMGIAEAIAISTMTPRISSPYRPPLAGSIRPYVETPQVWPAAIEVMIFYCNCSTFFFKIYFALKVKLAVAAAPAATVTFWFGCRTLPATPSRCSFRAARC